MAKKKVITTEPGELVEVGKTAPAFTLSNQDGAKHKLSDYRGQWIILYFYPKDDTPGCTTQACQFRDAKSELASRKAVVLGVSPDDEASHQKFAGKFKRPFALLADHDAKVCAKYGTWQEKSMYGRKYMGVARTTYLINPAGKIAKRYDKVKVANHEQAVLDDIDVLAATVTA